MRDEPPRVYTRGIFPNIQAALAGAQESEAPDLALPPAFTGGKLSLIADSMNFCILEAFAPALKAWTPLIAMLVGLRLQSRMWIEGPVALFMIVPKHGSTGMSLDSL